MSRGAVQALAIAGILVAGSAMGRAGDATGTRDATEARDRAGTREVPSSAAAASSRDTALPLTLENIHHARGGAGDAVPSPDGRLLAVGGDGPRGEGIYVLALEGGGGLPRLPSRDAEGEEQLSNGLPEERRLIEGGRSPTWGGGDRLAFVRAGELWVAGLGAVEGERTLTSGFGDVRDPAFSPDGSSIAFYSGRSGKQEIWAVSADGELPPRQLTTDAMAGDDFRFRPAWSPDGSRLAYVSNRAGYWRDDVWVVEVTGGEAERVSRSLMASSTPVWSPDGRRIALFGTDRSGYWYQDLASVWILEPAEGTERRVEMQAWASDFIMRHRPIWSADGRTIYFPYHQRGDFDLWAVRDSGGVATRVTNLGGVWRSLEATPDASRFFFVRSEPTRGPEVWTVASSGGPEARLTNLSPRWKGLQAPAEISFRSHDGLYIQGFLYLPPGAAGGQRCPALVQVHGGGTNSEYRGLSLTEQWLASRGYVVLSINYRGGSGFGRAFQDLAVEDWLNGQALDAGAAADYLRALPWANGRVGIYGGSYGGSMSLAAATRTPGKFDAAVPMRGAYSKTETLEHTDRLGKIFTITGHGGTPEERPDTYEKSNTVARLDRLEAPVLLMHGTEDRRVPIEHFELAVAELERLGKEHETMTYPEGHGFRDPANRIDMYGRLAEFFDRHLGSCRAG